MAAPILAVPVLVQSDLYGETTGVLCTLHRDRVVIEMCFLPLTGTRVVLRFYGDDGDFDVYAVVELGRWDDRHDRRCVVMRIVQPVASDTPQREAWH